MVENMRYMHTPAMGQISGFGGSYEAICQSMLDAGVRWLLAHSQGDVTVLECPQIYGIVDLEGADAADLEAAVMAAEGAADCTGVMHHAVMARLAYIREHGWAQYCAEILSKRQAREGVSHARP